MTKGSFSCKQSVIYGHRVNSCKQKPARRLEQQLGPFLAAARLHFLSIHAKVFRTAISSVLIWVCSPTGLAKPFIILGAWNSTAPSQVVVVHIHWPRLFPFHQMRGRYSSFEVLPSVHLSDALLFLYRCEGKREMAFHTAHLSYGNYIDRVNRVMTTWPLCFFFGGSAAFGFGAQCAGKTKDCSVFLANEE